MLQVYKSIIKAFAGPATYGRHSSSVQHTLYRAEAMILERIPKVW